MCDGKGMMHGMCHHRGARVLGAIIVTLFIFWCGLQFGEMRASFGGERGYYGQGYGMMQGNGYNGYGYGPGMMRGYNYGYQGGYAVPVQATGAVSAPVQPTTTK